MYNILCYNLSVPAYQNCQVESVLLSKDRKVFSWILFVSSHLREMQIYSFQNTDTSGFRESVELVSFAKVAGLD